MDAESNLRSDFRLIETMRFDGLAVPLLARHMARMRRSAQHFDFPFAAERMHATVQAAVVDLSPHRCWKVRLTLARDGMMRVETAPLPDIPPEGPRRLMLSSVRIDPDHLLDTQETVEEAVLHPEDLHRADGLFCCNAVRGWRPAEWAESVSAPGASPEA